MRLAHVWGVEFQEKWAGTPEGVVNNNSTSPRFYVSVDFKEFSFLVNGLESILTNDSVTVDSKGVWHQPQRDK